MSKMKITLNEINNSKSDIGEQRLVNTIIKMTKNQTNKQLQKNEQSLSGH